jgi:hypothetical protein
MFTHTQTHTRIDDIPSMILATALYTAMNADFLKIFSFGVRYNFLLNSTSDTTKQTKWTAVTMKNGVFWNVTPCGSCKNRRFGGT